jgi:pyruvate dehydrogenase E1 component beta subunit
MILSSVKKTGRLIVADTGWAPFGVCAEVSRLIAVSAPEMLKAPVMEISMAHSTCPTAKALENYFYPDMGTIVDRIYRLAFSRKDHKKELPSDARKKLSRQEFKGPF